MSGEGGRSSFSPERSRILCCASAGTSLTRALRGKTSTERAKTATRTPLRPSPASHPQQGRRDPLQGPANHPAQRRTVTDRAPPATAPAPPTLTSPAHGNTASHWPSPALAPPTIPSPHYDWPRARARPAPPAPAVRVSRSTLSPLPSGGEKSGKRAARKSALEKHCKTPKNHPQ